MLICFTKKEKKENRKNDRIKYDRLQFLIKNYFPSFNWRNLEDRKKLVDVYYLYYDEIITLQAVSALTNPTLTVGRI